MAPNANPRRTASVQIKSNTLIHLAWSFYLFEIYSFNLLFDLSLQAICSAIDFYSTNLLTYSQVKNQLASKLIVCEYPFHNDRH